MGPHRLVALRGMVRLREALATSRRCAGRGDRRIAKRVPRDHGSEASARGGGAIHAPTAGGDDRVAVHMLPAQRRRLATTEQLNGPAVVGDRE